MAGGAINFYLDATDDPLLPDMVPSFDGGQFSNLRANLLQPNQSTLLSNVDIDKLGKLRTRRGTILIGDGPPSGVAGTIIQGLTSYQTKDYNYVVAANNGLLWKWTGSAWVQIATGGTVDNEDIVILRQCAINFASGYTAGTTDIVVDGLPAVAAPLLGAGDKLYFMNNLRTNYFEYTIKTWTPGTSTITLEDPGLVFDVKDNWNITVARPAKVNNVAGYAAGATTIAIDVYSGEVFDTEKFVIKSENVTHTISSHTPAGAGTTGLTFTPGLQAAYTATNTTVPVVFAQGNDALYFSDGIKDIYGWNGGTTFRLGTHSILDNLLGSFHSSRTNPPTACKVLLWYRNRLIASGIAAEPDAVYFSDFFDATSWDQDYQKMRIGGGESDPITGITPWTDMLMIVFKKNSIYGVNLDPAQNPNPDDPTLLVASYGVTRLHKSIGCPAPRSAVQIGGGSSTPGSDIFFMDGDKKVHSVRRVMAAETQQEVGAAVSLPIQDILDTVNLDHIDTTVAFYHNEHYILGFPSTRGADGGLLPNAVVTYNLLTQSWCGVWSWAPTCFSVRTDLGSYSKLIFGDWRGNTGRVLQWLDDQSLDDETTGSYQDFGLDYPTSITTRAFTFGDYYSFKTGLSVEFEFDESVASKVFITVILDKVPQHEPLASAFDTISEARLILGASGPRGTTLPFTLPASPGLLRKAFDLQRYGTWRELQFVISTTDTYGKLAIRSIRLTGFMDTIRLQTIPNTGIPAAGIPPAASSGGP